ncbi:MAG: polysaccharide biosynthesis tyrosine autokinase [Actinomycetota bacterium]
MEIDLRGYVRMLARRKWSVLAVTAVVAGTALGWALLSSSVYEARARVLVTVDRSSSLFGPGVPVLDPNRVVQTEALAFESPQLRDSVRQRVGEAPPVAALQVDQTDVIEVIATAPEPQRAAEVANAYAEAYVDQRRAQAVEELLAAAAQLQERVSALEREVEEATGAQRDTLIDQQALFRQRLDQLQVDSALRQGGARVISVAVPANSPVSPVPVRSAVVGAAFGLVLGLALALLREYLDESVRSPEDAARAAPGVPVIGMVPEVAAWRRAGPAEPVTAGAPGSAAAEAFRTLRTALSFLSVERAAGVVQVTSAVEGEGKSSVAAHLAVAMARTGRRTVVVDCDLRRPRQHELFGIDGAAGLSGVLAGTVPLAAAVVTVAVPGAARLAVLPAGAVPDGPAELLATERMGAVIAALAKDGTFVVVDSPPTLAVADALVIAGHADLTVVVCRTGLSTVRQLRRALELLDRARAPVAGLVVNGTGEVRSGPGGYGYQAAGERRPASR